MSDVVERYEARLARELAKLEAAHRTIGAQQWELTRLRADLTEASQAIAKLEALVRRAHEAA